MCIKPSVQNITVSGDVEGEEEEELGEEGEEEEEGEGGREAEELAHIPGLGASQDTELVVTGAGWEGEEEEEEREASQDPESPHLTPRRANWSSQGQHTIITKRVKF